MYFSINIRSSPNEDFAYYLLSLKPSSASASFQAIRIPLPPPPADALIMTGYLISLAILRIYSSVSTVPKNPGTVFTLAYLASFFD